MVNALAVTPYKVTNMYIEVPQISTKIRSDLWSSVSQTHARVPLLVSKNNHGPSHHFPTKNTECPYDRYSKLKIYTSEPILDNNTQQ
jgi:hypothetical protein